MAARNSDPQRRGLFGKRFYPQILLRNHKEIKRRTRVATLFPNEASVLRLVSAVLSEISDDWETERSYLNMKAR